MPARSLIEETGMPTVTTLYSNAVYRRIGYLATWLPNTAIRLGDVGTLHDNCFNEKSTLTASGIEFRVRRGTQPIAFSLSSESGVQIAVKAKGQAAENTAIPKTKAGVALKFAQKGGFIFQATECYIDEIEDKAEVIRRILELSKADNSIWNTDWALIDTVVRAGPATIVISNSEKAALELSAESDLLASGLAKADAKFSVSTQEGDVIHILAQSGLSPLFKASRIKRRWLGLRFAGKEDEAPQDVTALCDEVTPTP